MCREICDRQIAYALQLALDGDSDGAKATVAAAKVAAILIGLLFLASWLRPFQEASSNLWLAGKAGLLGAAFSIALAIRGRTVALDTELLDNLTDGTLHLLIGVMSAKVFLLLLGCGILPPLTIGNANFTGTSLTWQMVLVVGFVGGFLERLVPELLEKRNPQTGRNGTSAAGVATK